MNIKIFKSKHLSQRQTKWQQLQQKHNSINNSKCSLKTFIKQQIIQQRTKHHYWTTPDSSLSYSTQPPKSFSHPNIPQSIKSSHTIPIPFYIYIHIFFKSPNKLHPKSINIFKAFHEHESTLDGSVCVSGIWVEMRSTQSHSPVCEKHNGRWQHSGGTSSVCPINQLARTSRRPLVDTEGNSSANTEKTLWRFLLLLLLWLSWRGIGSCWCRRVFLLVESLNIWSTFFSIIEHIICCQ